MPHELLASRVSALHNLSPAYLCLVTLPQGQILFLLHLYYQHLLAPMRKRIPLSENPERHFSHSPNSPFAATRPCQWFRASAGWRQLLSPAKNCANSSGLGHAIVFVTPSCSSHRLLVSSRYWMLIFTQQSLYSMDNHLPVCQAQKPNTHSSSKEGFRNHTSCFWMNNTGIKETESDWRYHYREQRQQCSQNKKESQTFFLFILFHKWARSSFLCQSSSPHFLLPLSVDSTT